MDYIKKKREKRWHAKKHDPKKIGTHEDPSVEKNKKKIGHMKVQEKKEEYMYINLAISSCYPNKRERDS